MKIKYLSFFAGLIAVGSLFAQTVSTKAGVGVGSIDAETRIGESIPGFGYASGFAIDASGNYYVSDEDNYVIKKITPAGEVTLYAGTPGVLGYQDGDRSTAKLGIPKGLAFDAAGNLYFADQSSSRIRMIDPSGNVSLFAGNGNGYADGAVTSARFNKPVSIAFDASGVMYVAEETHKVRKITGGVVSTLAGSNTSGSVDATGTAARFNNPKSIAVMSDGSVLVADQENHKIRLITSAGVVTTFAGTGSPGLANGPALSAGLSYPSAVAVDEDDNVYFADLSYRVRKIDAATSEVANYIGSGIGHLDGPIAIAKVNKASALVFDNSGNFFIQEPAFLRKATGGILTTLIGTGGSNTAVGTGVAASFKKPTSIVADGAGNLYITDFDNNKIRLLNTDGEVTTYAGTGALGLDDGNASVATFNRPYDLALDNSGNLFVTHQYHGIRKITPAGVVSTFAGSLSASSGNTNGTGNSATFNNPKGMVIDPFNNIYVADAGNHSIRKITSARVVTTFAGSGTAGSADGNGTAASFNNPTDLVMDLFGNLYVTDAGNNKIRKITPSGDVTTVAGSGTAASLDGTGLAAQFHTPTSISIDANNNMYISDIGTHKIRKVTLGTFEVTTWAGSTSGYLDGAGATAKFNAPAGVEVFQNVLYVADRDNHKIREISLTPNNLNPQISDQNFSIEENSTNGTAVGTVVASDPDAGQILSYSIVSGNIGNAFALNSTTGELTVTGVLDYETTNSYSLVIKVDDSGNPSLSASATITVNILDLIETSLLESNKTAALSLYPNPAKTTVWIEVTDNTNATILDLSGKVIMNTLIQNKQIDVSKLNTGVYCIEINQNGNRQIGRLIIE